MYVCMCVCMYSVCPGCVLSTTFIFYYIYFSSAGDIQHQICIYEYSYGCHNPWSGEALVSHKISSLKKNILSRKKAFSKNKICSFQKIILSRKKVFSKNRICSFQKSILSRKKVLLSIAIENRTNNLKII